MIECSLESDRRCTHEQRCVDDIAMTDDPADIRRCPPDVTSPEAVAPLTCAGYPDLVGAVRVDGELGFRGRPRCGEDEGWLVRFHDFVAVTLPIREGQEIVPPQITLRPHRRLGRTPAEDDDALDARHAARQRLIDDVLEPDLTPAAPGNVGGKDRARTSHAEPVSECASAEPGEHHDVDGADTRRCEHESDRFRAGRHVDADAVATLDAQAVECGSDTPDETPELRVRVGAALAPFSLGDQRSLPAATSVDVSIECGITEIGLPTDEPAEGRRFPDERLVPGSEPERLFSGP
ncbi:hypothetical protein HRbin27_00180 [bacterium HR27]|nr:hypothetical protein HRbin27_00180 [bacterium HR27]